MGIANSVTHWTLRLALLALGMTLGWAGATSPALPHLRSGLIQVDVYDRASGAALPVYRKDGRHYIVGTPGHEYAVRIRNCTAARVLVVTGVDGVNVISGETAAPSQSGYVLDPWGSVEIKGWRKNLQRTAAFFFTEHQNAYATRTGRPDHVGVIGVAVFRERVQPAARIDAPQRRSRDAAEGSADSGRGAEAPAAPGESVAPAARAAEADAREERQRHDAGADAMKSLGRLGTGHGRGESSRATLVRFERASDFPAETVVIHYDRRENLAAIGVLPALPPLARRDPNPFPGGMRFAPDPQ